MCKEHRNIVCKLPTINVKLCLALLLFRVNGVNRVNSKRGIEVGRKILYNAANMHVSREVLLKISQKVDKYIVEYLRKGGYKKEGLDDKN